MNKHGDSHMPQITLKKKQIDQFSAFLRKHDTKKWFLAKDDGAYIGATGGSQEEGNFENIIFHFKGMNPATNEDAWDNARYAFGGDDFGEHFDAETIHTLADDPLTTKMVVNVGRTSISIKSWAKKAPIVPVVPAPKKVWQPEMFDSAPKKQLNKGERIRQLLTEGVDVDTIVGMVGTTANSVRWHKSKMKLSA